MPALDRSYWLAVGILSYLGAASIQQAGLHWPSAALLVLGPVALVWVWRVTRPNLVSTLVDPAAQRAGRIVSVAALSWLHARLGPAGQPFLDVAATASTGAAAVSAAYALARIAPVGGLVLPAKAARSVDAAAFTALLWGAAITVVGIRLVAPDSMLRLDPLTLDYATTASSIGSLLVLFAAAWRVRVLRQLELGVSDRAEASVALSVTALAVAVPLAAIGVAAPDRVLPAALLVCSVGCVWTVLARDPGHVSAATRGTVAVMLLGVPTALAVGILTRQMPDHAGPIALAGALLSILAGLVTRDVARPLGPEQSRWLDAIQEANQNALVPEPVMALSATLIALKRIFKDPTAAPQLWRLSPASTLTVDVAGYMHESPAEIPAGLCDLGMQEPERTLRMDTLKALEVHRPEVRPLLAWFDFRKAFSATIVQDEEGPLGYLLLPRGGRTQHLTLEEARALRLLADRIGALFSISSALARSRQRESALLTRVLEGERRYNNAESVIQSQETRHKQFAETLARPLLAHAYSPAVRLALLELGRRAKPGESILLATPSGVDALTWAAAAHGHGQRPGGPFLVVDAAAEVATQSLKEGAGYPWHLAWGGTVFIRDVYLLPTDALADLLQLLTETPTAPREIALPLIIGSITHPLPETPALTPGSLLGAIFKTEPMRLPSLAERAEDLRSLILDVLSRRRRGSDAVGVERRALQLLMDHDWPGNERELVDVIERALPHCSSALLSVEALCAARFAPALDLQLGPVAPGPEPSEAEFARTSSGPPRRRSRAPRARARN
jgi:hypothetical protein